MLQSGIDQHEQEREQEITRLNKQVELMAEYMESLDCLECPLWSEEVECGFVIGRTKETCVTVITKHFEEQV